MKKMSTDDAFVLLQTTMDMLRKGDQTVAAQVVAIVSIVITLGEVQSMEFWRDMDPIFKKWIALGRESIAKEGSTSEWPDIFD